MNWCGNQIDDTKEFVSDALTAGKEFVKGQCERGSKFRNNPSLMGGLDWLSGGYVSACNQRYKEADDFYGYANWALSGIPDMVKGAFNPEKPGSFDHFMDSLGVATLFTSVCSSCTRGKVSASKNVNSSFDYSPINPGPLDKKTASSFRNFSYTEKVLSEDTTFYRVYGGEAKKVGSYMTRTPQYGGMQSQIDLALNPSWNNTATYVTKVIVPEGTIIYEGVAAPQIINGGAGQLIGGGNQVYIPEVDSSWFN